MLIQALEVGPIRTNCYIVADEDTLQCAVIDPGAESSKILLSIEERKLVLSTVFITHGHYDHTTGISELVGDSNTPVFIHASDSDALSGQSGVRYYDDGDRISVGALQFEVIATPGHSPGSVCLKCEDALFTGDTLFKDSCGRTDLPGGSMDTLLNSLKRLYFLEGDYDVYPGHEDFSTLEHERKLNNYMLYAARK